MGEGVGWDSGGLVGGQTGGGVMTIIPFFSFPFLPSFFPLHRFHILRYLASNQDTHILGVKSMGPAWRRYIPSSGAASHSDSPNREVFRTGPS